ncbi:MAG: helix-turn-helix domain-containing protein [Proteobacteria bacterium]|nr:helix-turn-helix domain-containing protein [Pseudomonadota bacterium]
MIDAEARQAFARELAKKRRSSGKTQTQVAALMQTSASIVSRLEAGSDVRVSTLEKYVAAIGMQLDFRAVPRSRASGPTKRAATKRAASRTAPRAARKAASKGGKKKTG